MKEEGPDVESGEHDGPGDSRGSRQRGWGKRNYQSSGGTGVKTGITWVQGKIPRALGRGVAEQGEEEEEGGSKRGWSRGGIGERRGQGGHMGFTASVRMFDELWLPPGLVTLAQDVLLVNRARGGVGTREEGRYFIAQTRGAANVNLMDSGQPLWKPAGAKFQGLEAAVFPFLLLPLVPPKHQPQAFGQLSRLLDANPANAAVLCHLRVPLALLKLACLLPEQSQVRDLYFRLAAQLMSHHMSPADALELFHLASLQPSAWARLGRLRVTSMAHLIQTSGEKCDPRYPKAAGGAAEGGVAEEVRVRNGVVDDGAVMPPHSTELQMQLLYVIGTVVDSPSPAWFFHMDGSLDSGLVAGSLARFPGQRVGYSLSMWVRPSGFSGGETALFSMSSKKEDGSARVYLRVSLRRCLRPGDSSAPPAAAGIGASEDDDQDQGIASNDASAVLLIRTSLEEGLDQPAASFAGPLVVSGVVNEPEVRCGRWQYLVVTHFFFSETASDAAGWSMDRSIGVYLDGERYALVAEAKGKSQRTPEPDFGALAYPTAGGGAGALLASVGCWEEDEATVGTVIDATVGGLAARFSGQIATVALVEGAWTAETAKAAFLRGPGAPPPGKRVLFTGPGDLPPTPFLDAVDAFGKVERSSGDAQAVQIESVDRAGEVRDMEATRGAALKTPRGQVIDDKNNSVIRKALTSDKTLSSLLFRDSAHSKKAAEGAQQLGADSDVISSSAAATVPLSRDPSFNEPVSLEAGDPPDLPRLPNHPPAVASARPRLPLSVMLAPVRRAIDLKYGVAVNERSSMANTAVGTGITETERGPRDGNEVKFEGEGVDGSSSALSESMASTVNSLAVAAGCGGTKESLFDNRASFKLAGRGTWVYATTPLHTAVQAAGGFRLCLPFLRMDHARQVSISRCNSIQLVLLLTCLAKTSDVFRTLTYFNIETRALQRMKQKIDKTKAFLAQVAALRVLAGLLEASLEGMDAFRLRDGFNVLYHELAQGDDALRQVS